MSELTSHGAADPSAAESPGRMARRRRTVNWFAPTATAAALAVAWEATVRLGQLPPYMLPAPTTIVGVLWRERGPLGAAWLVTVETALAALAVAVAAVAALATLFAASRPIERSLFPLAVVLQVTPLAAMAPFLLLWIGYERTWLAQISCAAIVAFFPLLSNTLVGLRSVDRGLQDLFTLYQSSGWQRWRKLLAPAALPYFLAGLRISANLALVGAVVAELVTGVEAERAGLATTIFAAQTRSDAPLMFAALTAISGTGLAIHAVTHLLSSWLLRPWHESTIRPDWI